MITLEEDSQYKKFMYLLGDSIVYIIHIISFIVLSFYVISNINDNSGNALLYFLWIFLPYFNGYVFSLCVKIYFNYSIKKSSRKI